MDGETITYIITLAIFGLIGYLRKRFTQRQQKPAQPGQGTPTYEDASEEGEAQPRRTLDDILGEMMESQEEVKEPAEPAYQSNVVSTEENVSSEQGMPTEYEEYLKLQERRKNAPPPKNIPPLKVEDVGAAMDRPKPKFNLRDAVIYQAIMETPAFGLPAEQDKVILRPPDTGL